MSPLIKSKIIKDGNITRLKNLLREYRGHIITKKYTQLKEILEIVDVIEVVDNAIKVLLWGL